MARATPVRIDVNRAGARRLMELCSFFSGSGVAMLPIAASLEGQADTKQKIETRAISTRRAGRRQASRWIEDAGTPASLDAWTKRPETQMPKYNPGR